MISYRSVVALAEKYSQLRWPTTVQFITLWTSTFVDNTFRRSLCRSPEFRKQFQGVRSTLIFGDARIFTARCYASAVLAMALCLSVCPSQVGVLLKRLNVGSHKQHQTIVQGLYFSEAKDLREIRPGSPHTGAPNAGGVGQNRRLSTNNRLYLENGKR